jgi:CHAT domain-containing protein
MVATHLPQDSALIEFVRTPDFDEGQGKPAESFHYLALVLTPENEVSLVDLGPGATLEAALNATLGAIERVNMADLQTGVRRADGQLAELYERLLRPLAPALGTRTRLILSPDGKLNKLPFAALRTPDGHYLIEQMTLSYVASGRDLLREGSTESTLDLALVANPAFDDTEVQQHASLSGDAVRASDYAQRFAPLPGTAEEARVIPPLLPGKHQVLQGPEATESAVRSLRSPKVLHLATHGFFLPDAQSAPPDLLLPSDLLKNVQQGEQASLQPARTEPRRAARRVNPLIRSGLAFAGANHATEITTGDDGLLTALEVSGMDLHGTDLVVLSACGSGLGEVRVGEGVYGLHRAFMLAGAKTVVMSLWPVNDQLTFSQMAEFYRAYGRGEPAVQALATPNCKASPASVSRHRRPWASPWRRSNSGPPSSSSKPERTRVGRRGQAEPLPMGGGTSRSCSVLLAVSCCSRGCG